MFIAFCSLFFGVLFLSASFCAVASSRSPFCSSSSFPFCAATSKFVPWISILRHDGQGLFHQSFCLSAGYLLSCNLTKRITILQLLRNFTGMKTNIPSVNASFYGYFAQAVGSIKHRNYPASVLVNLVQFGRISFNTVPLPCFFQYFKAKT